MYIYLNLRLNLETTSVNSFNVGGMENFKGHFVFKTNGIKRMKYISFSFHFKCRLNI